MRHLLRNGILVIAVLLFLAWSTYPPSQKLRLGKDLRGGVTLVYAVQIDRSEDTRDVLNQTIDVLKQRVDPQGLYEIRMVAQGNDRIEVTMPLPGPEVKALRDAFEDELAKLEGQSISADEFERAMRLEPAERGAELERLSAGNAERLEKLQRAARALDDAQAAREAIRLGEQQGQADDLLDELAAQAATAEREYESLRQEALAAALDPEALRLALELPTSKKIVLDENKMPVELPSARERAMTEIREAHPDLLPQIEQIVEAWNTYTSERTSLDDTSDLKRLLAGAGILSFRIAVEPAAEDAANSHPEEQRLRNELREKGPRNVQSRDSRWLKLNDPYNAMNLDSVAAVNAFFADPAGTGAARGYVIEPYHGEYYMLCWDTRGTRLTQQDGQWGIAGAFPSSDQLGRPAIGFEMDARGARLMGELTSPHVGDPMAVLLDDEVYTAPNINERLSRNIQISGDFSQEEISYVIRTLTAGSLQARLSPEPLSETTVAPDLGADNLKAGMLAGIAALITVSAFMILYYFGYGIIAVVSLACNAVIILGCMSLGRAAFSLPGIAGVILTFGMAVDANVLIYERVREELRGGKDLRVAVKLGYQKALSSIVDGNVTNLIVCFVLAYTGTQEIKGFAITLGIGVVSTMFSALLISRVIFAVLTDHVRIRKMSMLPMAVPLIERALHPKIDWIRGRYVFIVISTIYVGIGVGMCIWQGQKMLDTEFRGGTQVELLLRHADKADPTSPRLELTRSEVADRVTAIGADRAEDDPLQPLRSANVIAVDPEPDGVTSDTFLIKTYATATDEVRNAIIEAFQDQVDARPALMFRASDEPDPAAAPVYAVESAVLGESVGRPELREDVREFLGGAAVLLENIEPRPTLEALKSRLSQLRGKPDFSDTLARKTEVRIIKGNELAVEDAVVLVFDEGVSVFDNPEAWRADVRDREWNLAREALTQPTTLASVQSFSAVIAESFRAQAVVAVTLSFLLILIYIWVRFGSVRYSLAAIIALVHDVMTAIGLIALAEIIYESHFLESFAAAIGIEPFKIDLNLVAALLTIVGYSLNDTIIIMDRIRENRGKLPYASRETVNLAINQTVSRTLITSGTTLIAVLILYIYGGAGVRAFSYALLVGVVVGTYSSIAVASPLVWSGKSDKSYRQKGKPTA